MTQEQRNLLIRDLSARLPYEVKVNNEIQGNFEVYGICENIIFARTEVSHVDFPVETIKPYLFPLSSMTEEQVKEMQQIIGNPDEACVSVNTLGLELWLNPVDTEPTIWLDVIFEVKDWLNKNHFDYRGLIKKSLALDATNLNIY